MELLSFDIEIADIFELGPDEDFEDYAPFHITVAATAVEEGEEIVWVSRDRSGIPDGSLLLPTQARQLLQYLDEKQDDGYAVCAWNGLGFDLRWIGYQAHDVHLAGKVALRSYDPMFQFFCIAGFPVGLAKVAQAMGVSQKKLMEGAEAPVEWRAGKYRRVMEYCLGDCQITNQVVRAISDARAVRWINRMGKECCRPLPELKPVEELLSEPVPDQSWMDNPIPKEEFYRWIPWPSTP